MSKITSASQKLVDQLLVGLLVVGGCVFLFSLSSSQWMVAGISVLLAFGSYFFLHYRIKNRVTAFSKKIMGQMEFVKEISPTGFKVFKLDDQSTALHQWRDISQVVLKNETDLVFKFQNNKEKVFATSTIGYYNLLKNIPQEKLLESNIKKYQQTTFENLRTCPTCGYIAYKKTNCLSCRTDSFETAMYVDQMNKAEYLKEKQLEYFCTEVKGEPVEFYPKKKEDDIFEFDKNWKPIVTKEEVIEFSKQEYWD